MNQKSEYDAVSPVWLAGRDMGIVEEHGRIMAILMDRITEIEELAKSLGESDDVNKWPTYVQAVYFEVHKIAELIEPPA
jgi:hypothetical protein